ncbi:hypothetical protein [Streptoalloteichus hindustanus]|uniref:Uncharacterized protein n=1 Tax=Streptoalloteichus hindustanus TaxID=2017 RepID=A0A1M5M6L3_STRHI|nr:hypothetical protein [Streptoalloteichus hindustanus]SHG72906.1 hypothetical protein SAMN05444320_11310 [Streptoalloteichus hindustanus]
MTSPSSGLLLPYEVELAPLRTAAGEGSRVRVTIGRAPHDRTRWPVRCARILLTVPLTHAHPMPLALRTRVTPVASPVHGGQWWVHATTTDPNAPVFTCVPETPATFDGTWSLTVTLDLDQTAADAVEVVEHSTSGDGSLLSHAGRLTATRHSGPSRSKP